MIYSAGNFIECTTDTPYLQIGEHKYGKPVLDRAISFNTDLYDALKIGLISMDSTMRSNLGVGLPIDILGGGGVGRGRRHHVRGRQRGVDSLPVQYRRGTALPLLAVRHLHPPSTPLQSAKGNCTRAYSHWYHGQS